MSEGNLDGPALFDLGECEVTDAARDALGALQVDPLSLFRRHQRGDWGAVPDWRARGNDRIVKGGPEYHTITSHYLLDEGVEVLIVTGMSRSRTRLQLDHEYRAREVSAIEGYAIWAQEYDKVRNNLALQEEAAVVPIIRELGPVGSVLDVGTGTGRHALRFSAAGSRVLGMDESWEMLSVARGKAESSGHSAAQFIHASVGSAFFPLQSQSFDLVISALMLTHVADLALAISECVRVARSGGTIILSDFHPSAVQTTKWRTSCSTPDGTYNLPNPPHSRAEYLEALQCTGCTVRGVHDIASDCTDYGEVTEAKIVERGPPRCLVVVGEKL
jgi:ubiquinone/menaquinone biosynthesis C-methylase UbiE